MLLRSGYERDAPAKVAAKEASVKQTPLRWKIQYGFGDHFRDSHVQAVFFGTYNRGTTSSPVSGAYRQLAFSSRDEAFAYYTGLQAAFERDEENESHWRIVPYDTP